MTPVALRQGGAGASWMVSALCILGCICVPSCWHPQERGLSSGQRSWWQEGNVATPAGRIPAQHALHQHTRGKLRLGGVYDDLLARGVPWGEELLAHSPPSPALGQEDQLQCQDG